MNTIHDVIMWGIEQTPNRASEANAPTQEALTKQ
jgi:hypothetical protein